MKLGIVGNDRVRVVVEKEPVLGMPSNKSTRCFIEVIPSFPAEHQQVCSVLGRGQEAGTSMIQRIHQESLDSKVK